ncbi:DMT family transporter [Candidatus Marsarchaeota archaeon]|nr:DMT family transporter [Candidatus Marsarchaeota archaeon]
MIQWYYLALISSSLVGIASILEKRVLKRAHALSYSSITTILIALLSFSFIPFLNFDIKPIYWIVLYVMGFTSAMSYWLTARAYKHANISVSTPVLSTMPQMFTVILGYLLLGEVLSYIQYAGIAILLVATFILVSYTARPATKKYAKRYPIILAAIVFLMAIGSIMLKFVLSGVTIYTALFILEMFVAFNLFVILRHNHGNKNEIKRNLRKFWKPMLAIAVLAILYRITYYAAAAEAPISLVYPIRNVINIMIIMVASSVVFHEKGIKKKIALSAVMIIAAVMIII